MPGIYTSTGPVRKRAVSSRLFRFKPLVPFAIAERLLFPGPAGPNYLIGYLKTNYYSVCNDGSSIEGKDATNR